MSSLKYVICSLVLLNLLPYDLILQRFKIDDPAAVYRYTIRYRPWPSASPPNNTYNALSIKCWNCRSNNDPKCADPFDNSTVPITDCKQEKGLKHLDYMKSTMCRKIRQKVNGEWRYFRDCAYLGEVGIQGDERFCLMRTGTYNIFIEYCTCNSKDGCNSSSMFSPRPYLIMLMMTYFIGTLKRYL